MGDNYPYDKDVFIPKLTTETLVKVIIKNGHLTNDSRMLDLCTGSGCVAISVTKNVGCVALACDIDSKSLKIAEQNCKNFGGNVEFFKMDVLGEWKALNNEKFYVISANPPYWSTTQTQTNQNMVSTNKIEHYSGGEDGLLFIRTIICNSVNHLKENGMLFIEFANGQEKQIKQMLLPNFKKIKCYRDWHGLPRVISAMKK